MVLSGHVTKPSTVIALPVSLLTTQDHSDERATLRDITAANAHKDAKRLGRLRRRHLRLIRKRARAGCDTLLVAHTPGLYQDLRRVFPGLDVTRSTDGSVEIHW